MTAPAFPTITIGAGSGLQSSSGIERPVYALLKGAFETLATTPAMVDRIFRFLDAAERANIKAILAAKPPAIRHGFARTGADAPLICIAVGSDQTDQAYLDDSLDEDEIDEYGESATGAQEIKGERVGTTLQFWIFANSPDTTMYLYHLTWAILSAMAIPLNELQITAGNKSGGDVQPQVDLMPDVIFARMISCTYTGNRCYVVDEGLWGSVVVRASIAV